MPEITDEEEPSTDSAVDKAQTACRVRRKAVYERPPQLIMDPHIFTHCLNPEDTGKLQKIQDDTNAQGSIDQDKRNDSFQFTNRNNIPVEDSDLRLKIEEVSAAIHSSKVEIKDVAHAKGVKEWLKDPRLYKVSPCDIVSIIESFLTSCHSGTFCRSLNIR